MCVYIPKYIEIDLSYSDSAAIPTANIQFDVLSSRVLNLHARVRTASVRCKLTPWGGDGPSGPRMDDSDGMGYERLFTPFKTLPTALHLMSKHLTKVMDDS